MAVRLLAVLGVLVLALTLSVAPAAAAGTGGAADQPGVATVLGPGQTIVADNDCGCNRSSSSWGTTSGWGGSPVGMGFGMGPWWAGQPLWAISAQTGGTWPFAPWYSSPQWWTYVGLTNAMGGWSHLSMSSSGASSSSMSSGSTSSGSMSSGSMSSSGY
ncbi:MAG TPA: hypothetical protein VII06_16105 [Chloroflexota bacterium]|jgi:hypothetical protein